MQLRIHIVVPVSTPTSFGLGVALACSCGCNCNRSCLNDSSNRRRIISRNAVSASLAAFVEHYGLNGIGLERNHGETARRGLHMTRSAGQFDF